MKRFPDEFSTLLTPRGRKLLEGKDSRCGALERSPFFTGADLIDPAAARAAPGILARAFSKLLVPMEKPAPPATSASIFTAQERLPKTVRVLTTEKDSPSTIEAATECGLYAMIGSASFRQFVAALAGRPLTEPTAMQVLCYRPGDYSGPHTDNHPEQPATRNGYVDAHLTFTTPGVDHQYLVYEREGHLSQVQSITATGSVTVYRLPFWHYTTPLVTKRKAARRWLVLGSFLFQPTI